MIVTAIFVVGVQLWLQRVNRNSEKSEHIRNFQNEESFCVFFTARHRSQTSPLIFILFFNFLGEKMSKALLDMGIISFPKVG